MPRDLNALATDDLLRLLPMPDNEEAGRIVAELVARHQKVAYRSALRHCRGNAALADDVFQETFIRLFQWLRQDHERLLPGTFDRVLGAFVRRTAIDIMRKETRHASAAGEEEFTSAPAAGSDTDAWEVREDLNRILADLPERPRVIIQMMLQGMSVTQVADALGISEVSVRVSRHRALAALRARMAADKEKDDSA